MALNEKGSTLYSRSVEHWLNYTIVVRNRQVFHAFAVYPFKESFSCSSFGDIYEDEGLSEHKKAHRRLTGGCGKIECCLI